MSQEIPEKLSTETTPTGDAVETIEAVDNNNLATDKSSEKLEKVAVKDDEIDKGSEKSSKTGDSEYYSEDERGQDFEDEEAVNSGDASLFDNEFNLVDNGVEGERQQGDGEENSEKPVDDDEDRKNPQFIPKKGAFYEHDDRLGVDDELDGEEKKEEESVVEGEKVSEEVLPVEGEDVEIKKRDSITETKKPKKLWNPSDKWGHDMFKQEEQDPKSKDELVTMYGYDIRNEDNAPKARRRRRYARGPVKYTRNWQDEDAYGTPDKKPGKFRKDGDEQSTDEKPKRLPRSRNDLKKRDFEDPPVRRRENLDREPRAQIDGDFSSGRREKGPGNWNSGDNSERRGPRPPKPDRDRRQEEETPMRSLTFENSIRYNNRKSDRPERVERYPDSNSAREEGVDRNYRRDNRPPRGEPRRHADDKDGRPIRKTSHLNYGQKNYNDRQKSSDNRREPGGLRRPFRGNQNNDEERFYDRGISSDMQNMSLDKSEPRTSKRYSTLRQQNQHIGTSEAALPANEQQHVDRQVPLTPLQTPQFYETNQHSPGYYAAEANHSPSGSFNYMAGPSAVPEPPGGYLSAGYPTGPAGSLGQQAPLTGVMPGAVTPAAYLPSYPPSGYPQYPPAPPPQYHAIPGLVPPGALPAAAALTGAEQYHGGTTYYDPNTQQQQMSVLQKRPKTIIPIVPPPDAGDVPVAMLPEAV